MSNDQNQCNFTGRLAKNPTSHQTTSGIEISNFCIAVGRSWKNKETGVKEERTEWINIVAFNGLAGVCNQYLTKGQQVRVTGEFTTRKWQDKDGNERYSSEIKCNDLQMLGGRGDNTGDYAKPGNAPTPPAAPINTGGPDIDFTDDVPFAPLRGMI